MATIIDVLEGFFDGDLSAEAPYRLSDAQIEGLAVEINRFYDEWTPPDADPGSIRVYGGSWAGAFRPPEARQPLLNHLLYADSVVVHDPLARYFDPEANVLPLPEAIDIGTGRPFVPLAIAMDAAPFGHYKDGHDPGYTREFLSQALPDYRALAPLIQAGLLLPTPHRQTVRRMYEQILLAMEDDATDEAIVDLIEAPSGVAIGDRRLRAQDSTRAGRPDMPPVIGERQRGPTPVPGGLDRAVERRLRVIAPTNFLNRDLAIAGEMGSRYVPSEAIDWRLLKLRLERTSRNVGSGDDISLVALPAVGAGVLPLIDKVDIASVVAIRQNEDAFESWRAELRDVVRLLESDPGDADRFEREAREAIEDRLKPQIQAIRAARSKSSALKSATREAGSIAVTGALSAGGMALAGGDPASAGIGLAAGAAVALVRGAVFKPSPTGAKAVIARLTSG